MTDADEREALARIIGEKLITRSSMTETADAILASDWLAARERAAERRGAAEALGALDPDTDGHTPDLRFQVVTGYGDQRATVADFLSRDRAQQYADEVNASYQRDDFRVREVKL